MDFLFLLNSALLGVGLAMDAFSVSAANGLHDPGMRGRRKLLIAGTFAFFQFLMPMIGWFLVKTAVGAFTAFQPFIPWTALLLLAWIGGKMIIEGIRDFKQQKEGKADPETFSHAVGYRELFVQGIATSIDALSVGFTIETYTAEYAFVCSLIVAAVTLVLCLFGIELGKKAGTALAGRASIVGGCILVGIGIEVFLRGI